MHLRRCCQECGHGQPVLRTMLVYGWKRRCDLLMTLGSQTLAASLGACGLQAAGAAEAMAAEGERLGLGPEVVRLLRLGVDLLPLVPARRRDQAAPRLECFAVCWCRLNAVGPRIEGQLAALPRKRPAACNDNFGQIRCFGPPRGPPTRHTMLAACGTCS